VRRQYQLRQEDTEAVTARRRTLISTLAAKDRERQTIIGMARRGTIRPDEAETQLEEIASEQRDLQLEMDAIANRQAMTELFEGQARSAEGLLNEIRMRVAGGLDDETKRAVVRQLLGRIVVHTEGEGFRKQAHVSLEYLFRDPVKLATDVDNLHTA
jgi:site-specific DNA recombinase